jgi:hypothetical protein
MNESILKDFNYEVNHEWWNHFSSFSQGWLLEQEWPLVC